MAAQSGDRHAAAELLPLLYAELRSLGKVLLRKLPPGQTLQATALLHEAYGKVVGTQDPLKGRIVMLKFFAGMNMEEVAAELSISKSSVERQWRYIRAWLYKELDHLAPDIQDAILDLPRTVQRRDTILEQDVPPDRQIARLERTASHVGSPAEADPNKRSRLTWDKRQNRQRLS